LLDTDLKYLPGVGPRRKKILEEQLGLRTYGDLLEYFPYKHIDRSKVYTLREIDTDMPFVQLKGKILSFEDFDSGPRKKRVVGHFTDGTGIADLVWFNPPGFLLEKVKINTQYIIFGKPTIFNGRINIAHPEVEEADKVELNTMGMQPYYSTTEKMKKTGLTSRAIEKLVRTLLDKLTTPLPETLTESITRRLRLCSRDEALRQIHYPQTPQQLEQARRRLKFEELFYLQLSIARYSLSQKNKYKGYIFKKVGDIFNGFYFEHLPFQLTGAQKRVLKEIRADTASGRQMNRLLQGDVGSGKTLVALMSMLLAIDNGYQACIMAPTEILAEQHLATIRSMLG